MQWLVNAEGLQIIQSGGKYHYICLNFYEKILLAFMRFLLVFAFLLLNFIKAQNLLKNGDFEIRSRFNNVIVNPNSNLDKVKYWDNPNRCSPDIHFRGTTNSFLKVGKSNPHQGNLYLGLNSHKFGDFDEYVETKLKRRLIADSLYCLKLFVMADSKNQFYLSSLYAAFNAKYYHQRKRAFFFLGDTIGFRKNDGSVIDNTDDYLELSKIYKANGYEKYFLLGNFNKYNKYSYLDYPSNYHKAISLNFIDSYYYYDNLSLEAIKDSSECPCYYNKTSSIFSELTDLSRYDLKGKKYVLRNFGFHVKMVKSIKPISNSDELNFILEILRLDATQNIRIESHSFDSNFMPQNKKLSIERVELIKKYFLDNGILPSRIEVRGQGSAFPIFDNDTKEHYELNTRIEVYFLN